MSSPPLAISLESIRAAAERIEGLAHRTPVLSCRALDAMAAQTQQQPSLRLFFKCENLQKVGAFKYRGALNAVKKHLESSADGDRPTFVTHSSGNHGQALALAARDAGCSAVIVMPTNAPEAKQRAVEGYGATIERTEPTVEARERAAQQVIDAAGGEAKARFVHPSNDPDVMSGQGTVALELLEQAGQPLDAVLVPIGGGGLCSGVAMAVKSINPNIKVYAVEPEGAADSYRSFTRGEMGGHEGAVNTIADGLRTTLGDNNWPVIKSCVDGIILVSDDEIVAAMRHIWERMKLVVEPSGAVATAGVLFHKLPSEVRNVGIVFSGGNVDLDRLPWATRG